MSDERDEEERGGKVYPHPEYDGMGMVQLALEMNKVRMELDAAKEVKSKLQKKYDYITMAALPKAMGWADGADEMKRLQKFRPEGGRGISVYDKYFTSVLAQNRLTLHEWLKDHKLGDLVVETVNGSTLKAWVTRCHQKGEPYPAELINVAIVPTAKFY